jgi:DNA-binding LacI/PurR family transcriptional regulator
MITLHDVARAAKVSVATASKALSKDSRSYRISEECQQRVQAVCRELGYQPNYLGRSLQSGKSLVIGTLQSVSMAVRENVPVWSQMNAGMTAAAVEQGYQLVTMGAARGQSPIRSGIQSLREKRIDGLVVPTHLCTGQAIKELEETPFPVVLAAWPKRCDLPAVELDEEPSVTQVVEHLVDLGHRRFLWVAPGDSRDFYEKRRFQEFHAAFAARGLMAETVAVGYSRKRVIRIDDQVEAVRAKLLTESPDALRRATAVVAYNEPVGFGVYAAAMELGLRIPCDLSVVSFDDIYAQMAYPPMTVVSLMMYDVGERAVQIVMEMAGDAKAWTRLRRARYKVSCELVLRKSTGPARV